MSPLVRILQPETVSLEEFWSIALGNPDLRMEREPNGDVTLMSPANGAASLFSSIAFGKLFAWAETDGTGYALDSSAGCQLPDGAVRSPDASWIAASRWTPQPITDDAPVPCPDFVIEVRSGSDRLKPAQEKMQAWIANGCQLAWLIDPVRKVVEIYRTNREPEALEQPATVSGEGPVAGFVLDLGRIWA
jgi:Uma2 family endonuclease